MKSFKNLLLFFVAAALFTACKKDKNTNPDPGKTINPPSAQTFNRLRNDALNRHTQKFVIDLDTLTDPMIQLRSEEGATIKIHSASLRLNGNPVSGKVTIDFIELYDAGNMLVTNKTTMGLDGNGNLVPIITGGAFYINATKDGQDLDSSAFITLQVPGRLTGGIDHDMVLWQGETDNQGNLTWNKIDTVVGNPDAKLRVLDSTYSAIFNQFGWTNIDKFTSDPRPKTKLKVVVPNGYTDSNCVVYLKYKGEPNALARLDAYNEIEGYFTEHYGYLPIGIECHIIFATATEDGKWRIGIKSLTIEADKTYTFTTSETQIVASNSEVTQMINDLP